MTADRRARLLASPQFRGGRFHNPVPERGVLAGPMLAEIARRLRGEGGPREPTGPLPVRALTRADFATPPASGLRVTWLGHSTLLVELDGATLLLDPVWAERASPVSWAGPRRFHPPPLPLEQLPPLDAVIVSHNHYDHLDRATVGALAARGTPIVTSLGVGETLERWGIAPERVIELDWHERTVVAGVTVTATPALHFSGRGLLDRNRTLWSSWALAGPRKRLFFTGDTALFPGIADIGRDHGPFDLNLIKIGAYSEAWPDVHQTPEQAVVMHRMLGGDTLLAIHWGTFNLAFHAWNEPPERLLPAAAAAGVRALVPRPGEPVEVGGALEDSAAPRPWWREVGKG